MTSIQIMECKLLKKLGKGQLNSFFCFRLNESSMA